MSARAHHALLMAAGGGGYVDDYVTPYGVWSAEKKLIRAYSGNAIRVRRSSDNAEQDIAFASGVLDTAALLSFVGANSGYVTKIYQQVAALTGADLVQATTAAQPRIVNAGTLEADYVWHDGSNDYLRATLPAGGMASAAATLFFRARINTVISGVIGGVVDVGYTGSGRGCAVYYDGRTTFAGIPGLCFGMADAGAVNYQIRTFPNSVRSAVGAPHKITVRFDRAPTAASDASIHMYMDGSDAGQTWGFSAGSDPSGAFDSPALNIGRQEAGGYYNQCGIHSIVLIAADALAQRVDIEALL